MSERASRGELPGRLLRLLSLLQHRREWSGRDLADRLGVTDRTLRRDIERLRALDYPIDSSTGTAGGYRMAAGKNLPPLVLDDDEAIAVATGLITAEHGVTGMDDSATRALAKLEQVLPTRLRPQLTNLLASVSAVSGRRFAPPVDPEVLALLAACCRDHEFLSFDYRTRRDDVGARRVEPHRLVSLHGHWYLLAYDPDRSDWRTFRLDRISGPRRTRHRFQPRPVPGGDAASYVVESFASARYRHRARMTVGLSAETLRGRLLTPVLGEIEDIGPEECAVHLSAESADLVVQCVTLIAATGAAFTLDAPAEIAERVRTVGRDLLGS